VRRRFWRSLCLRFLIRTRESDREQD
jgi:hypothetical protein